jgi:hypothetical protein
MPGKGKKPNPVISFPFRRIIIFLFNLSRVSSFPPPISMADTGESHLNIGAPVEKQGHGRPRGSKNKASIEAAVALLSAPVKRRPGRPVESKNKPKVLSAAPGPSASSANASSPPPKLFSFFCIASPQCREIQRLNFTKFIDG